jgi:hypothetical protein
MKNWWRLGLFFSLLGSPVGCTGSIDKAPGSPPSESDSPSTDLPPTTVPPGADVPPQGGQADAHNDSMTPSDGPSLPSPVDASCSNVNVGPYDDKLPVPTLLWVEPDDHNARISWGKKGVSPELLSSEAPVTGFRLCFGKEGEAPNRGALFTQRIGQVFGLTNGAKYVGYLQSVDSSGHVSKPSASFTFAANTDRVDALRKKMTGFFDDFDTPGPLDELKWNTAFSACADPAASAAYVTEELHAVTVGGTVSYLGSRRDSCDRLQIIARPRAVFDFTNREGIIAFDFDGSFGMRESWYVDVFPYEQPGDVVDITSHITFGPGSGHPGRFLRFAQSIGDGLIVNRFLPNGDPVGDINSHDFHFTNPDVNLHNGVLRHWELHVAKDHASVFVDGEKVYQVDNLGLDFSRGYVEWAQFGYNPPKEGLPWVQFRFDNFGFDGPASTDVVTHNYKTSFDSSAIYLGSWVPQGDTPAQNPETISIPDSLVGATAARLMFTTQNPNYTWTSTDSVTLNGQKLAIPKPTPVSLQSAVAFPIIVPEIWTPWAIVMKVDPALLRQGANTLTFQAQRSTFFGFHVEVDFPSGSVPSFTQPTGYLKQPPAPMFPVIGPTSSYSYVNDNRKPVEADSTDVNAQLHIGTDAADGPGTHQVLSGISKIGMHIDNVRPLTMSGRNWGISKVEMEVDGKVVQTIDTSTVSPAPESHLEFQLDTTKLSNGEHQLYIRAYDVGGNRGREGYDKIGEGSTPTEHTIQFTVKN